MEVVKRMTTEDRERAVLRILAAVPDPAAGATVKEVWDAARERHSETVTQQAYHKLMVRLTTLGRVELVADAAPDEAKRYRLSPHLHAENAMSLDDVYEQLEALSAPEAIARVLDARDYFEQKRTNTLAKAAEALLDEDPRVLIAAMVEDRYAALSADVDMLADSDLRDRSLETRIHAQFRDLAQFSYRYLGLSRSAVDIARPEDVLAGRAKIAIHPDALREELKSRVFGDRFITGVDISAFRRDARWDRLTVAGSDGSTHGSVMQLSTASAFADDMGHQAITFNNSIAYVELSNVNRRANRSPAYPFHSVPMTRSALEDPVNRGMVLAPFMYRYLSESEYEHMAKCATDVVQWRVDATVFSGTARSLKDGDLLPQPRVHFRDGTVTPQEREYGHYKRRNEYGDMVREGISHGRKILSRIVSAPNNPPVFAGAVKATQLRLFASVLNWFVSRGSAGGGKPAIDPHWDVTRAAHISDNEAMSILLSTLEGRRRDGLYFTTCVVARPFHTLTEFFNRPKAADYDWVAHFERTRDDEIRRYESQAENEPPYLSTVAELSDDDFVFMMSYADYAMFYIGHTAGEPPPIAPRYEFIESLRSKSAEAAGERVGRNVQEIVAALDRTRFASDQEHNFLTAKKLVKIIPFVIHHAHEQCKSLGRQLEAELRSVVVARLKDLKSTRGVREGDIAFVPISIRRFLERYARADKDAPKNR